MKRFSFLSATMDERELSVYFTVPSSLYTQLFLTLSSAPVDLYTARKRLLKNTYNNLENLYLRVVQDDYGFTMQEKQVLRKDEYECLYKYGGVIGDSGGESSSNLTLVLPVKDSLAIEKTINLDDFRDIITGYRQIVRDYIYRRDNGIRIAIERRYTEYIDSDIYQMDYDCFNRYNFECLIHIEGEYEKDDDFERLSEMFLEQISTDEIIYRLFLIMSNKNLNNVSDEIININNMSLVHKYGHLSLKRVEKTPMEYYSLKLDGVRKNFCIFGKYIQINRKCFEFKKHWFGQVIIGHCECLNDDDEDKIILIDVYIISENFHRVVKKTNMSYTTVLQNYHHFYRHNNLAPDSEITCKTQDEYFHMKRLKNKIKFLKPLEAINILHLLTRIWRHEDELNKLVHIQRFYKSLRKMYRDTKDSTIEIDGILGYTTNKIFKIKQDMTIDLVFKFDEMFSSIYKRMKTNNHDLKKMIQFINFQKTLNWLEFEHKYPDKFNKFALDFLYFTGNQQFSKLFPKWETRIDVEMFCNTLATLNSTFFMILMEFRVDFFEKRLTFIRIRDDKCSANSVNVFRNMMKQF